MDHITQALEETRQCRSNILIALKKLAIADQSPEEGVKLSPESWVKTKNNPIMDALYQFLGHTGEHGRRSKA